MFRLGAPIGLKGEFFERLCQRHPRTGHRRKHKGGTTRKQCAAFDPIPGSHG
jgi:hypothetical protein